MLTPSLAKHEMVLVIQSFKPINPVSVMLYVCKYLKY